MDASATEAHAVDAEVAFDDTQAVHSTPVVAAALCPNRESVEGRAQKRAKLDHPIAPLVPDHQHDTRHARSMHCLAKVATVITAIVRMRRWLKCRQRAIKARAADTLVMPQMLRPSAVPMHTDVAGESIVDTAEATAMDEEELIAEAPSISSC